MCELVESYQRERLFTPPNNLDRYSMREPKNLLLFMHWLVPTLPAYHDLLPEAQSDPEELARLLPLVRNLPRAFLACAAATMIISGAPVEFLTDLPRGEFSLFVH